MISTKRKTAARKPAAQTRTGVRAAAAEPTAEAVARRAYEKFQARGGVHGNDVRDWLEAERELKEQFRGKN